MIRFLALALFLAIALHAKAALPEGSDGSLSPWFQSLERPDLPGASCCNTADCRMYEDRKVRITEGAYEIFIDGNWRRVPSERIVQNKANPTGQFVACYTPSLGILCLVRPAET